MKTIRNIVDDWNSEYSIGTAVVVRRESGEDLTTKTRSRAMRTATDYGLIWVVGLKGPVDLTRVRSSEADE